MKADKVYRSCLSLTVTKKSTTLYTCVFCADMPGFRRPSHKCYVVLVLELAVPDRIPQ